MRQRHSAGLRDERAATWDVVQRYPVRVSSGGTTIDERDTVTDPNQPNPYGQQPYPQEGAPQQPYGQQPYGQQPAPGRKAFAPDGTPASDKTILVAFLLVFFFGALGVHRFYVGKIGTGILQILTLGGIGIWALIDLIMIVVGAFKDSDGRKLVNWT